LSVQTIRYEHRPIKCPHSITVITQHRHDVRMERNPNPISNPTARTEYTCLTSAQPGVLSSSLVLVPMQ